MAEPKRMRKLTRHERFSLTRQNVGEPHVVCQALSYPESVLPSASFLSARIDELQEHFPLLWTRLVGGTTRTPYFEPLGAAWPASAILSEGVAPVGFLEDVAVSEMRRFEGADFASGPLWTVRRLAPAREGAEAFLVVAVNHTLTDGRGTQRLLGALVAGSIADLPTEDWDTITRCDDTIPQSPSLSFLAPLVFRELLLPKLPLFVQRPFRREPVWPGTDVVANPLVCPGATVWARVPASVIAQLKAQGKARGVPTLHPSLLAAFCLALWAVFQFDTNPSLPLNMEVSTARDERVPALGHAYCTANYVGSIPFHRPVAPADTFWGLAREAAEFIASPAGITDGRMQMGTLSYVPDTERDPSDPRASAKVDGMTRPEPTGWETFFLEKARSDLPFLASGSLSNLGFFPLPPGATDHVWCQTASTFSPPFNVSIVGHEGGLRVATSFKAGSAATLYQVDKLHQVFVRILEGAVEGRGDCSIQEIAAE